MREMFKWEKEEQVRRGSRMVRVKETVEGIREGRKKFNELILIYESRIAKLEEKIRRARTYN